MDTLFFSELKFIKELKVFIDLDETMCINKCYQ